jgi:hypothetical protein
MRKIAATKYDEQIFRKNYLPLFTVTKQKICTLQTKPGYSFALYLIKIKH